MRFSFLVVYTLTLLCIGCAKQSGEAYRPENMARAQIIVDSLDRYYSENGSLPETLDLLVPDYLPEIPKTTDDQDFRYEFDIPEGYLITFDVSRGQYCSYISRWELWDCGLYDPNH